MQKLLIVVLVLLLVGLQYRLWIGPGSLPDAWRLKEELAEHQAEIEVLHERNAQLEAEVADLKAGLEAIEERARSELGMIGESESFYRVVSPDDEEIPDGNEKKIEQDQGLEPEYKQ